MPRNKKKLKKVLNYPLVVALIKEETRADAPLPQKEKYPSGKQIAVNGLMWEFSRPEVGNIFMLHETKMYSMFNTSSVREILEETDEMIRFKTSNSIYRIEFKNSE